MDPTAPAAASSIAQPWRDRPGVRLAAAGFVTLFLELALIRWAPAQARVLAYYTNFVLLAAFFGLGLGLLLRARARIAAAFPVLLFLTVNAFAWIHASDFNVRWSGDFYLWQFAVEGRPQVSLPVFLAVSFVLVTLPFVPIGVAMGRAFQEASRLPGYAANVAGSLAGILAFTAMAAAGARPWAWFAVTGACAVAFLPAASRVLRWANGALFTLVVVLVYFGEKPFIWSPYYQVLVQPQEPAGWVLHVNTDYHQIVLDLSDEALEKDGRFRGWRRLYDLPHEVTNARRTLVVGSGTGNDVAAAVRAGVPRVDAVEIDPAILDLGRRLHPEQPYSSPGVRAHCTDARAFFRRTQERYDLVVFGFLDSHALLSSLSSVRLDSYVYTVESLREVRRLLEPDGVVALTFSVEHDWIGKRLFRIMEIALGEPPVVVKVPGTNGTVFLAGPGLDRTRFPDQGSPYAAGDIVPATDAWPFLYFKEPGLPPEYVVVLVVMGLIAVSAVAATCWRAAVRPDLTLFALGAGFMLLETRSVTVLALLMGSTWTTNALVFTVILVLSLLATLWTVRFPSSPPTAVVGALLLASFVAVALFPLDALVGAPAWLRLPAAAVPMLPLLFAGVLFARAFARSEDSDVGLGSNLLGAVAGGMCEHAALVFGFPALLLIAAGFYALALAAWRMRRGPPLPSA